MRRLFAHIATSATESHRVVSWDEVGEAEGTGIVHLAPGCGEEDFDLGKQYNLPVIAPLDENGNYIEGMGWLTGKHVSQVTDAIVADLKSKNLFYRLEKYAHRYPECWRCHEPLIFRLVDEWFISMDGIRQPMIDITNQIRWIPDFGRDRELDWLRNMHDWMISKKRYWGLALPIWECDHCGHFDVIGSRDELHARAVEGWNEFDGHTPHRPFIDAVKIACGKCGAKSSRIKDVGNPWLDAGIVSFSTMGYKSDPAYWRQWFPADFITESFPGQFRNWFYSLLVMAAVLENKPATKTILGYGTLLAESGDAMHKSAGNMIEFNQAADEIGADVMRWMYAQQKYEDDLLFGFKHASEVRRLFFLPLWNVYVFFTTYAALDKWKPKRKTQNVKRKNELDRWILSRLQQLIEQVTTDLDDYHVYRAAKPIEEFLNDLSNWYVRRSRRRFWKSRVDSDKQAAYETLYEVLVTLCKLLAPFVPFVTEAMYQNLVRGVDKRAPASVHHCAWPKSDAKKLDARLLAEMDAARQVVTLGHGVRGEANLKVRQPLARVLVVAPPETRARLAPMRELIADELNVKALEFVTNEAELVSYNLLPDNRALGPKFGARFPKVRAALAQTDAARAVAILRAGKHLALNVDGQTVELEPSQVIVTPQPKAGFAVKAENEFVVALDTQVTDELRAEGLAREFVRHVQDLRKSAGFEIEDRIVTHYAASDRLARAIRAHARYIAADTLSVELVAGVAPDDAAKIEDEFDGESVTIGIVKAKSAKRKTRKKAKDAKVRKRAKRKMGSKRTIR
jgi:isoleucyl-tRNA synthetase